MRQRFASKARSVSIPSQDKRLGRQGIILDGSQDSIQTLFARQAVITSAPPGEFDINLVIQDYSRGGLVIDTHGRGTGLIIRTRVGAKSTSPGITSRAALAALRVKQVTVIVP
ncbi:MAG: hypothetical protein VX223_16180 [Myxococcota bacterium]|nr:hypothetical protein [Myxococcota bacterium]